MRLLIYGLAGLLLLLAGGIAVLAIKVIDAGPNEAGGIAGFGQPTVGGPFSLIDGDGKAITEAAFADSHTMIYFGYTFCPDVCPTELIAVAEAIDLLPSDIAAKVRPVFISIDPERDTPDVVKDYVSNFHPTMVGLTGTPEQVKAAAKAYRVYFAKGEVDPKAPDDYLMAHSSFIYVMDQQNRYLKHFSVGTSPEDIAKGLRELL
ncbi:MAG: SCO family protein [Alphaproteobacteria bacterium]|jgi:cytochrome oxidase Cu insertion factor (SCO1/SenC/PrrC family)